MYRVEGVSLRFATETQMSARGIVVDDACTNKSEEREKRRDQLSLPTESALDGR